MGNSLKSTVKEGNSLILSCKSESSMPVNFYWMKNDVIIENEILGELVFKSVKRNNIGIYKCGILNQLGNKTSSGINIDIMCKLIFWTVAFRRRGPMILTLSVCQ